MIHHRIRVYGDTRYPSVSISTLASHDAPIHTTAFVPGFLNDNGNYERTDCTHLPQQSQNEISAVWTADVHTAYEEYLNSLTA